MPIPFNPPDWLIQQYMNRKTDGQQVLDTALQAGQLYVKAKQEKQAQGLAQQSKDIELAKLRSENGTASIDYLNQLRAGRGLPAMGVTAPPPQAASSPPAAPPPAAPAMPEPQGYEDPARMQSMPGAPPPSSMSPVVAHWHASNGSGAPSPVAGGQPPTPPPGGGPPANFLDDPAIQEYQKIGSVAYKDKYGSKGLSDARSAFDTAKKERDLTKDQEGPKSVAAARSLAAAGKKTKEFDSYVASLGNPQTLTQKQLDDFRNFAGLGIQDERGSFYDTTAHVKEQTMRDSLIKEARTSLDPYFQTGQGKEQADRMNAIGRTEPLIAQMLAQKGGGDPHQMTELATAFDRVLKGGGASAQANIEHLLPKTAGVTLANWKEWYTNNPQGTDQQGFIKRTAESLAREKSTIQNQIHSVAQRTAPTLRVLKSNYPEDYDAVVNGYMSNTDLMGTPESQTGAPPALSPAAQAVLNKHR